MKASMCSFLLLLFLSNSCNCGKKKESKPAPEIQNPFAQKDEVYEIINATLPLLTPKHDGERTLFLNNYSLVADTSLLNDFIAQGANARLLYLDREVRESKPLNIKRVKNFENTVIDPLFPLSNKELNKHLGGAIFSRMIFDSDETKATFIFHFERLHRMSSKIFCAIDVEKKKGKWVITSRTCLENHPGMLFE